MTENLSNTGLIYVFTGNGKGKTSAALGTAIRALSHGWRVAWIAFYKEESWGISEHRLGTHLNESAQKRFEMYLLGKGFYIQNPEQIVTQNAQDIKVASVHSQKVIDTASQNTHILAAEAALQQAKSLLERDTPPDVLVLDEVCNALHDKLIRFSELKKVLLLRKTTHIVLTGRDASPALVKMADLVSSITKRKHPYDKGLLAVPGLDF